MTYPFPIPSLAKSTVSLDVQGNAVFHGDLQVKGTFTMGKTTIEDLKKLPADICSVIDEPQTKTKWLVPDHSMTFQDQMVIGLSALLAEERAKYREG